MSRPTLGIVSSAIVPVEGVLALGWTAAYWTEGPEFQALGLADGAAISTWPDEIGTADLTQSTAVNKPTYRSGYAGLNTRPAADSDGGDYMSTTAISVSQPFTIAAVLHGSASGQAIGSANQSDTVWFGYWSAGAWNANAGSTITGGTANGNAHLLVFEGNGASSRLLIDGVQVASGNAGANAINGLRAFGFFTTGSFNHAGAASFYGIASGILSAGVQATLLAWSQSTYGTP